MATNDTLVRQTFGVTNLKDGMHTQLDFGINMGGIPPGYTSSHWSVSKEVPQKKTKKKELLNKAKELDPPTHFNIYFCLFACTYVCLGITAKCLNKKGRIWHVLSKNPGEHY